MPSLKDLRTRIRSIRSTQQITKAMKLVAASKLGRAQSAVLQSRPYAQALGRLTTNLADGGTGDAAHPLLQPSNSNVVGLVVLSSERGLCGGYNANVIKAALSTIEQLRAEGKTVKIVCIGKKAFQVLRRRLLTGKAAQGEGVILSSQDYIGDPDTLISDGGLVSIAAGFDKPTFEMAEKLARAYTTLFLEGKIGQLLVLFSRFQSAMTQIPTVEQVLPLARNTKSSGSNPSLEPIFEPSPQALLEVVLPQYVAMQVYQALLESVASEHGARMTAMDSATRNAKDMERRLQLIYQRTRQAAITKELIEIVSGAEAL